MKILKLISKFKPIHLILGTLGIAILSLGAAGIYTYQKLSKEIPEIQKVSDYRPLGVTQILSVDKGEVKVMAEFYKERRYLKPYDQIPEKVIQAFISAEDASFFEHQGINFIAIARAAIANFLAGHVVQGGSTITQQIAKSLYLTPDRNIIRKLKETVLAFELERNLKKEEILYLYLNQIYLGSGAYGVEAAARTYFQKDLKKITLAEAALIAGLPTAPGKYSPLLNPKRAKERQLYVLKRMQENGYISEQERAYATKEKIKVFVNDGTEKKLAPHFVEHLRRYLAQKYGEKALYEDGLTVMVPAAVRYYELATEALQSGLEEYDQRKGFRGPIEKTLLGQLDQKKEELKKELVKEVFPYRHLSVEGELDLDSAIQEYDPNLETAFLGKRMKAIVTRIAEDQKKIFLHNGMSLVGVSFDSLKWIFTPQEIKEKKTIAQKIQIGDVFWLKVFTSGRDGYQGRIHQIPEVQGALYSVDAQTGQILAMVGGYDFNESEFNRAVQAKRQMGSTFKPIIYAAAVERGYTPASIIVDAPIVFEDAENGTWKPENYEQKFYGDTTFRQALINSRNIPTVKIVQDVKVRSIIDLSKRLGIQTALPNDLSISLGSAVTSVEDMVHAFTAFPTQGKPYRPVYFEKILDRDGNVLETQKDLPHSGGNSMSDTENGGAEETKTGSTDTDSRYFTPKIPGYRLDPRVAYIMTHLMKEVVQFGTAAKANSLGRAIAGKTGTTQDFRDGWFVGFSPRVVTGVWVGFDDQRTLGSGETGANTALPIWMKYMAGVLRDFPEDVFPVPEGVVAVNIDGKTGKRVTKGGMTEYFIEGTEPGAERLKMSEGDVVPEKILEKEDEVLRESDE